jgi:hypothetical protein
VIYDPFDPIAKAKCPPVAVVKPAMSPNLAGCPYYQLAETVSIASGAWVVEKFAGGDGHFWYLKNKKPP